MIEAGIAAQRRALEAGEITSVWLVLQALQRIAAYDRAGPRLNAVPVLNPEALAAAHASDLRRAEGRALGPLDGIPYTAKDSYKVKGLTVAAGSPAFADLIANEDAFTIAQLRAGGAVLIGLTNMPPMANGGMQRGLYGRAESPWNGDYLAAAFASGSSNGSGTATSAGFASFGLAEETWSSGRAPAANSGLCAYTPSRGVISIRGNWPLVPTMDVVVPHARSMADLGEVLAIIATPDDRADGDFWRSQRWVPLPKVDLTAAETLRGKRFALPRLYANADPEAGTSAAPGIGGPTGQRIETRASIMALLEAAVVALTSAGAEVVLTDFPMIENYEGDRPGRTRVWDRLPEGFKEREILDLSVWAWDDFLRRTGHPGLAHVDGDLIFPHPPGSLPDRYEGFGDALSVYPDHARRHPVTDFTQIPLIEAGCRGLEAIRKADLEDWMDRLGIDAVIFPALADVGRADSDVNPVSADHAWRNGVWVANGNLALRHLGVPTVTLPMGLMSDTGMPSGLTLAGRSGDDGRLLAFSAGLEPLLPRIGMPPRTPPLASPPRIAPQAGEAPWLRLHPGTPGHFRIETSAPPVWTWAADRVLDGRPAEVALNRGDLVLALFANGQACMAVAP